MTYEYAIYFKILYESGYTDELIQYVNKALDEQDPLSDIIVDLSFAGNNETKILEILNEYINDGKCEKDDNILSNLFFTFLKNRYDKGISMADMAELMYNISIYMKTDEEPWYTMNVMHDLYSEAEDGYIDKNGFQQTFYAFINDKVCLSDYKGLSTPYYKKNKTFFEKIWNMIKEKI